MALCFGSEGGGSGGYLAAVCTTDMHPDQVREKIMSMARSSDFTISNGRYYGESCRCCRAAYVVQPDRLLQLPCTHASTPDQTNAD